MANIFEDKTRYVIPNLRNYRVTSELGELSSSSKIKINRSEQDFNEIVSDWRRNRSIGTAGDLISISIIAGKSKSQFVRDAANYVLDNQSSASSLMIQIANSILSSRVDDSTNLVCTSPLNNYLDSSEAVIRGKISSLRKFTISHPRDAIAWIELARLYSNLGLKDKSIRCIITAINITNTNRYVVRGAVRLFVQYEMQDHAYFLLDRSPSTLLDPWLLSAKVAVATAMDALTDEVKRGRKMIASNNFSAQSLSELNSSLATLEFVEGRNNKCIELFTRALEKPNDNTLAQVEWAISKKRIIDIELNKFPVRANYEALTREAYNKHNWSEVKKYSECWLVDMPFDINSVMVGSHITATVLEDYDGSVRFCQAGLISNPNDPRLLNNLAYALSLDGKPLDAIEVLRRVNQNDLSENTNRICLTATKGLALFRSGNIDKGRESYLKAIDEASKLENKNLYQLAWMNYVRELIVSKIPIPSSYVSEIEGYPINSHLITMHLFRNRIVDMYKRNLNDSSFILGEYV